MSNALIRVSGPPEEPVSIATLKTYLRVTQAMDDALLALLLPGAREAYERETGRALVTTRWELRRSTFVEASGYLELPYPPLLSVTSVKYLDEDGAEQTLAAATYDIFPHGDQPGRLRLAHDKTWPTLRAREDAVRVQFDAGYGGAPAVHELDLVGVMLRTALFYQERTGIAFVVPYDIPGCYRSLVQLRSTEWRT